MTDLMTAQIDLAVQQQDKATSLARSPIALSKSGVNMAQIEEAATDFEAMFITEMLKPMFDGVMGADPTFGGGKGEEVFKGFMLQEYGKMIAKDHGIGLAASVKAEMIRIQEMAGQSVTE